jgi:NTE family protein
VRSLRERFRKTITLSRAKIAIACQGGGSQTAFTAGVLQTFFEREVHQQNEIISLSGTSGGAVCASLAWYGLLKAAHGDNTPIQERLSAFWEELTAQHPMEIMLDNSGASYLRTVARGMLPQFELSPTDAVAQHMMSLINYFLPRPIFTDLKAMLEKHIDFAEAQKLTRSDSPVLVVGAADVLTGELKKFYSHKNEIQVEAILASAAVPTLFPAVQTGDHYYWDGLFSDNPPIVELMRPRFVGAHRVPDEIWVIQINPTTCKTVPSSPAEIMDRRNQMIGNVSFHHSLEIVEFINLLLKEKALTEEVLQKVGVVRRDPVKVRKICMSEELMDSLDYVSKLSREPSYIKRLIRDGEQQAQVFLDSID